MQYKMLGVINVRQVRVQKEACKVQERMQVLVPSCKTAFSNKVQSQAAFGPIVAGTGENEFKFTDQSEFGRLARPEPCMRYPEARACQRGTRLVVTVLAAAFMLHKNYVGTFIMSAPPSPIPHGSLQL